MRAWTYAEYGGPEVLTSTEIDTPIPGPGQVGIAVEVAGLNPADWHFMRGEPKLVRAVAGFGAPKAPAIIGSDVAGTVDAIGDGVDGFAIGDRVLAEVDRGACADVVIAPAKNVVSIPDSMTSEVAAALPMAGTTALETMRRVPGSLEGARILVNGASGGIGSLIVQLAATRGAEVIAVCSGRNVEMVAALGANRVIDYERDDFTVGAPEFDVLVDLVGNRSTSDLRRSIRRGGTIVQVAGGIGDPIAGPMVRGLVDTVTTPFTGRRFVFFVSTISRARVSEIVDLVEAGTIRPLIDRVVPFERVPEAMAHLETGHARGKVLIRIR
jgi:NADPH:quinone reductase-like Zn-dependent oxidoreductase